MTLPPPTAWHEMEADRIACRRLERIIAAVVAVAMAWGGLAWGDVL